MSQTTNNLFRNNHLSHNLTLFNDGYSINVHVDKFRKAVQKEFEYRLAGLLEILHNELRQVYAQLSEEDDKSLDSDKNPLKLKIPQIKRDIKKLKEASYSIKLENNITSGNTKDYVQLWIENDLSNFKYSLVIHGWKEVDE